MSLYPSVLGQTKCSILVAQHQGASSLKACLYTVAVGSSGVVSGRGTGTLDGALTYCGRLRRGGDMGLVRFRATSKRGRNVNGPRTVGLLLSITIVRLRHRLQATRFNSVPRDLRGDHRCGTTGRLRCTVGSLKFGSRHFTRTLPCFRGALRRAFFEAMGTSVATVTKHSSHYVSSHGHTSCRVYRVLTSVLRSAHLPFVWVPYS